MHPDAAERNCGNSAKTTIVRKVGLWGHPEVQLLDVLTLTLEESTI